MNLYLQSGGAGRLRRPPGVDLREALGGATWKEKECVFFEVLDVLFSWIVFLLFCCFFLCFGCFWGSLGIVLWCFLCGFDCFEVVLRPFKLLARI